jgi:hypothetical protein
LSIVAAILHHPDGESKPGNRAPAPPPAAKMNSASHFPAKVKQVSLSPGKSEMGFTFRGEGEMGFTFSFCGAGAPIPRPLVGGAVSGNSTLERWDGEATAISLKDEDSNLDRQS